MLTRMALEPKLLKEQKVLFDIKENHPPSIIILEKFWEVTMTANDISFYNDQAGDRIRYCTRSIDPRWRKSHEQKMKDMNRVQDER